MKEPIDTTPAVDELHYFDASYDSKGRFISYWYQIHEIISFRPDSVLEIGPGNGLVYSYLKGRGLHVRSLDHDERLAPDIHASVADIPVESRSFDVVSCCQVLEHLPFEMFVPCLKELKRVARSGIVLSLPDSSAYIYYLFRIRRLMYIKGTISLPRLKDRKHRFTGEHYWEIGKKGYPLSKIDRIIRDSGLHPVRSYRVFDNPYHRFFIFRPE
jgi:hypothetical protein